jgi:hypothetical protein
MRDWTESRLRTDLWREFGGPKEPAVVGVDG